MLVLPGWLTDDAATRPLRHALRRRGYAAHGWKLGRNLGLTDEVRAGLPRRLRALHAATGGPVSLVGMSLGGVLARRLAREHGLDDPAARLAAIRDAMDGIKSSRGALGGARLTELSGFAPPILAAAAGRLATTVPQTSFHTVTTNVPGPQIPLYFAGRRLLESAPTIPLGASIRTAVGIFSYNGGVHFGLTGDYDTVPEVDVLARGIEDGVAELLALRSPQPTTGGQP